eukprot:4810497-Pyramimonas_sp.AAC.1
MVFSSGARLPTDTKACAVTRPQKRWEEAVTAAREGRCVSPHPPPPRLPCLPFVRAYSSESLGRTRALVGSTRLVQGAHTLHTELAPGNPGCLQRC